MQLDLVSRLVENFPKLYSKLEYLECGDGWYPILEKMSRELQNYIDSEEEQQVTINSIQSVWNSLTIHSSTFGMERADEIIEAAEWESLSVDEETGKKLNP